MPMVCDLRNERFCHCIGSIIDWYSFLELTTGKCEGVVFSPVPVGPIPAYCVVPAVVQAMSCLPVEPLSTQVLR